MTRSHCALVAASALFAVATALAMQSCDCSVTRPVFWQVAASGVRP